MIMFGIDECAVEIEDPFGKVQEYFLKPSCLSVSRCLPVSLFDQDDNDIDLEVSIYFDK